jgi:hypothetical protein
LLTSLNVVKNYLQPLESKERVVRFEVYTAVTMKNAISWDIKTQFVPHREHMSPLQSPEPR